MRKLAFGYSTRCNLRCEHCVAADEAPDNRTMELNRAKQIIVDMARAGVSGISFSAGEPFLYFNEIAALVKVCSQLGIYTRVVTNGFWAATAASADTLISELKENGLCQLRLSCSRWHQKNVNQNNLVTAAHSCQKHGLDYFISFVTDFSSEDDLLESFLRSQGVLFFPEPVIYSGRANAFTRRNICTDYQANCCDMNPYLTPDLDMFACCDAGSHFSETNFFYLGNLNTTSLEHLFIKTETNRLYTLIRTMGITPIASFAGYKARQIITHGKCELCQKLFNSPETLKNLEKNLVRLEAWKR
ncbi:MAG: radical SAM protein [Proteobacteria bacterium]|nr:radical SAM protein [Desulfobacula sp.]MBU3950878.1 radical SAM protein [Pseudomonadota bacterium]MBU4130340.1 radical SAM protein [Pseudomonadota bacterium]